MPVVPHPGSQGDPAMIILLDDKTRIRGTEMCWQLETFRAGKTGWRPEKYYGTLAGALQACAAREIRTADVEGIEACERVAKGIVKKYSKLFDEVSL